MIYKINKQSRGRFTLGLPRSIASKVDERMRYKPMLLPDGSILYTAVVVVPMRETPIEGQVTIEDATEEGAWKK